MNSENFIDFDMNEVLYKLFNEEDNITSIYDENQFTSNSYFYDSNPNSELPNVYDLFSFYNGYFFGGVLEACQLKWSKRMTLCAGTCSYQGTASCVITLSEPLLKYRSNNELKETLLHEMIHAFLFITKPRACFQDGGHGQEFIKKMEEINRITNLKLSVFHSFHDEVELYRKFIWKCDGICLKNPPFFGIVKRANNRAPGKYDWWWSKHEKECGGKFTRISQPDNFVEKIKKQNKTKPVTLEKYFAKKNVVSPSTAKEKIIELRDNQILFEVETYLMNIHIKSIADFILEISSNMLIKDIIVFLKSILITSDKENKTNLDSEKEINSNPCFLKTLSSIEKEIESFTDLNIKFEGNEYFFILLERKKDLMEKFTSIRLVSEVYF